MHPEIIRPESGVCPKCGMALEPRAAHASEERNPELDSMTRQFWGTLVLTAPLFVLAMAPKLARRVEADGSEKDVALDRIQVGDRLRVRPGEKVPVDDVLPDRRRRPSSVCRPRGASSRWPAMALSSVSVVGNALRLRRLRIRPPGARGRIAQRRKQAHGIGHAAGFSASLTQVKPGWVLRDYCEYGVIFKCRLRFNWSIRSCGLGIPVVSDTA